METLLLCVIFIGWVWSIISGFKVSILCAICNFLFPPLSQVIFAIYEDAMHTPLLLMIVGAGGLFFVGN